MQKVGLVCVHILYDIKFTVLGTFRMRHHDIKDNRSIHFVSVFTRQASIVQLLERLSVPHILILKKRKWVKGT